MCVPLLLLRCIVVVVVVDVVCPLPNSCTSRHTMSTAPDMTTAPESHFARCATDGSIDAPTDDVVAGVADPPASLGTTTAGPPKKKRRAEEQPLVPSRKELRAALASCLSSDATKLSGSEAMQVFLAVMKMSQISPSEDVTPLIEDLESKSFLDAADLVLTRRSRNETIVEIEQFLSSLGIYVSSILLECFNETELAEVLGFAHMTLPDALKAATGQARNDNENRVKQSIKLRHRLLEIGLGRYEHWMQLMHDDLGCARDVEVASPIDRSKVKRWSKEDLDAAMPRRLKHFGAFLDRWAVMAERMAVDSIFKAKATTVVGVRLLGHDCDIGTDCNGIGKRKTGVDDEIGLVPRLTPAKDGQTLVLSGESGSGKTFSALALAKEKKWMTVYVKAETLFHYATSNLSLPEEVSKHIKLLENTSELRASFPLSTDQRNAAAAAALVSLLVSVEPKFKHAMHHASDPARRLAFIVDEAGQYPHLVRAMCSASFQLFAPSADGMPSAVLLKDHLKLPGEIQLVAVGTGVGAENGKCGSCPDNFEHIVVESVKNDPLIARLEQHLCSKPGGMATLYTTFCGRHEADGSAACQVVRRIAAFKSNPRLFACFVHEVMNSKQFPIGSQSSSQKQELSRLFTTDAAACAEFKASTQRAMMEYKDRNSLQDLSFDEVQRVILTALAYSCLARNSKATPARSYVASYGVLVDHIKRVKQPSSRDRLLFVVPVEECPTQVARSKAEETDYVAFVVPDGVQHRFSVSPALAEMGLSLLGSREPAWTRHSFARVMSDALHLVTCMCLQSTFAASSVSHDNGAVTDDPVLFNDAAVDPLCEVKRKIWSYAQDIAVSEGGERGDVPVLTVTLEPPFFDDEGGTKIPPDWPWVAVGSKQHQAIPAVWLLQELSRQVHRQLQPFMASSSLSEVEVVVHAMMYRDAPGIDGVIAYGTYRRGSGSRSQLPCTFHVSRLVKLQMKCRDREKTRSEGKALLTRMGKYLSKEENRLPEDSAPLAIEHFLLEYGEHETVLSAPNHVRLNASTISEALHPTQWHPADASLDERSEARTRCIALCPGSSWCSSSS